MRSRQTSAFCVAVLIAFCIGRCAHRVPLVAKDNQTFEDALSWCEYQIERGNIESAHFKMEADQIRKRQIRWGLKDTEGIYYLEVIEYAKLWQKESQDAKR